MGKRTRRLMRSYGQHKLPGESIKEFRKRSMGIVRPEQASTRTPRTTVPSAAPPPPSASTTAKKAAAVRATAARQTWDNMTVPQLRREAKDMGITGYSRMVRGELIDRMAELAHTV